MVDGKPNAQQRLAFTLGSNIFEVEMLRDRIDELMLQLAERDTKILELEAAAAPEANAQADEAASATKQV